MLRRLLEAAPDPMIVVDREGRMVLVNVQTEKVFGYDREELLGQRVEILIPESVRHRHPGDRSGYFANPRVRPMGADLELRGRRKDGSEFPVEISLSPIESEEGLLVAGTIRDVTARKGVEEALRAAEERLREGQKMEAIGRLAGGVAHDFNNLMTVVIGNGELALRDLAPDSHTWHLVKSMRDAGDRAASITGQLLAFSRKQILKEVPVDLNAIVARLERMLGRTIGAGIEVVCTLDPDLDVVKADPGQLEQVALNLALNARDAMPEGGRLTVETRNVVLDELYARQAPEVKPGHYVMLAVADSGVGMSAEVRARVFEPFFTTKGVGQGSGLGLSTVYGIVKQSRGYVDVESEPGRGTTFKVYLPKSPDPVESQVARQRADWLTGSETVLLVEDDPSVRGLTRGILETAGYTVLEAASGAEAVDVCERDSRPIDLLLTDMAVPGSGGEALAERVVRHRPGIKVLFMSGCAEDRISFEETRERPFVQKPFVGSELTRKVRAVLDGE